MINPDLHLHTYYSDGKESPSVVVRRAKAAGLDVIAITDHDGMGGVEEAVEEGRRIGVQVVRGVDPVHLRMCCRWQHVDRRMTAPTMMTSRLCCGGR